MAVRERISPFMRQCFVTAAVGLNIISFGCVIGFPAILLPQLTGSELRLSKEQESWYASVLPLSVLTGNFLTPPIMDRLGRKTTHYALTVISLVASYVTIMATSFEALMIGRCCQGLSGGLLTTLRSVLIGEYTSPKNRGAFLTTVSLSQAFGVFFVHLLGSFLSWQNTALVCVFLPFISLIMVIYKPESPSWLLRRGRYHECREVFRWLRGYEEEGELSEMIEARLAYERAEIKDSYDKQNWFRKLISIIGKREFYKPIILMIISNVLMHISGASTFAPYATLILGLLMGPNANAYFWMVFLDSLRLVSNTLAVYVINRVNRRTMVLATGLLSLASHVAIAYYVYFKQNGWNYEGVWLPALLINLQFVAVGMGMVPMPQVIGGEIFPLEYRSTGGTISMATGGGVMFLALKTFPDLIDKTGLHGTYGLYAVIILVNLVIMMMWLPETKGKTLQQIEDELRGRPLKVEEIQARESLQSNPIVMYKRKLSEIHCSTTNIA
ncbi:facilitated trehalose transporter Tret1-like [Bicyclus anynana]|uniref:Facilitated trehalose transporter Tret1-like n=1 Tax=Bicyclus anynana TaxID=110368 RepID=A0A6J1MVL0_BICAN|nr:facilitated trehalose transporter Tret1-like [Bicyclus anynana]